MNNYFKTYSDSFFIPLSQDDIVLCMLDAARNTTIAMSYNSTK